MSGKRKNVVILTGAGMSAESGLATFRDSDGLWEGHDVQEVASPEGFARNPDLVLEFYNQRRKDLLTAEPNKGHFGLVKLEEKYNVQIITQNVDDLHERAGSSNILHLHGELFKVRSTGADKSSILHKKDLNIGDKCKDGFQLRPDIVWFGEMVPAMDLAIPLCQEADIFIVIGTSLLVYPAASLLSIAPIGIPKYIIDPKIPIINDKGFISIEKAASEGVAKLLNILL